MTQNNSDLLQIAALAVVGLAALAVLAVVGLRVAEHKAGGCRIIGYTTSTILEGVTRSGEHVSVYDPSRAVCRHELEK